MIYLIVLFPILLGLAGGGIVNIAIRKGNVRNPFVAAIFGLFIGLIIYGTYHYADYNAFRNEGIDYIVQEMEQFPGMSDPELASQLVDALLFEEIGRPGADC